MFKGSCILTFLCICSFCSESLRSRSIHNRPRRERRCRRQDLHLLEVVCPEAVPVDRVVVVEALHLERRRLKEEVLLGGIEFCPFQVDSEWALIWIPTIMLFISKWSHEICLI